MGASREKNAWAQSRRPNLPEKSVIHRNRRANNASVYHLTKPQTFYSFWSRGPRVRDPCTKGPRIRRQEVCGSSPAQAKRWMMCRLRETKRIHHLRLLPTTDDVIWLSIFCCLLFLTAFEINVLSDIQHFPSKTVAVEFCLFRAICFSRNDDTHDDDTFIAARIHRIGWAKNREAAVTCKEY